MSFCGFWEPSCSVLDSRPRVRASQVVSLSKSINPILVLVQPGKTRPYITERLLMGRKESNQTKQNFVGFVTRQINN